MLLESTGSALKLQAQGIPAHEDIGLLLEVAAIHRKIDKARVEAPDPSNLTPTVYKL